MHFLKNVEELPNIVGFIQPLLVTMYIVCCISGATGNRLADHSGL